MPARSNLKAFVQRANKIHDGKFDYSKFEYINAKTASIIICPVHGEFTQKPDHHTRKNSKSCPGCLSEIKRERALINLSQGRPVKEFGIFQEAVKRNFGASLKVFEEF